VSYSGRGVGLVFFKTLEVELPSKRTNKSTHTSTAFPIAPREISTAPRATRTARLMCVSRSVMLLQVADWCKGRPRGEFLVPGSKEITRSTRTRKIYQESARKPRDFSRNMGLP